MPENIPVPEDKLGRIESILTEDQKTSAKWRADTDVRLGRLEKASATTAVVAQAPKFQIAPVIRGLVTGDWTGNERLRDEGLEAIKTRDMSVASASGGGYITPAIYSNQLLDLLTAKAQLTAMGISTISGVKGKSITIPRLTSGVSVAYLAENTALGASAPVFDQEQVTPHLAGAYCALSRLVAENSDPAAEQVVRNQMSRSAALFLDATGLFGSGAGSNPTGLFNNSDVSRTSVAAAITLDKCLDAITAVEARNGIVDPTKAAFIMHPSLWGTLRKAKGSTNDHYILSNDQSSATRRSIQGYPVYLSTQMQIETGGTDSAYAMAFGDFSQLTHVVWNDIGIETTNTGGDAFVKHQVMVKIVWADDWLVAQPDSFECLTDLYAA